MAFTFRSVLQFPGTAKFPGDQINYRKHFGLLSSALGRCHEFESSFLRTRRHFTKCWSKEHGEHFLIGMGIIEKS